MTTRAYYSAPVATFLGERPDAVLGALARAESFAIKQPQRDAWRVEIELLQQVLEPYSDRGKIYFEYAIPRLGRRIDVVVILDHLLFVLEFKVGEESFTRHALDQVCDYALDLKNFHETSHAITIAPVVVATRASILAAAIDSTTMNDRVLSPIRCSSSTLGPVISAVLARCEGAAIDPERWERGRYDPTPTIVEAAIALYGGHSVSEISRSDADATNLSDTSQAVSEIIESSLKFRRKSLCIVTGVPGAGKTLVGLDIATKHIDKDSDLYSVFLSGNGPLVAVLREALARDKVRRERAADHLVTKSAALSEVKLFIQNVHHFRDDCLVDESAPPKEHVALFDEAQRAWNREQTQSFMLRKKGKAGFSHSEPEFLISCLDRHPDWAVVVCLVGGGQEINTGEAGVGEWIRALLDNFPDWHIHLSPNLSDSEYSAAHLIETLRGRPNVHFEDKLHLSVSMRSFRTEHVSALVKNLLDCDSDAARTLLAQVRPHYPIVLARDVIRAKEWLRQRARGSERFGVIVSSQAQRLKPHAIDVRAPVDPVHWFLDDKDDVRSSFYLEDVATEFHVQGLELDWALLVWDADFRYGEQGWEHHSFVGTRWQRIKKQERQTYLKNAYRVLLTRARQGLIIVVPSGDEGDPTRAPRFYDRTFEYLKGVGFGVIESEGACAP